MGELIYYLGAFNCGLLCLYLIHHTVDIIKTAMEQNKEKEL